MRERTRIPLLMFLVFLGAAGGTASAASRLYFPQIADGGSYKTTLLLTNHSGTSTSAQIEFFKDSGQPWTVTIGSTTSASFTFPLSAYGALKVQTAGTGTSVAAGWARVSTSPAADIGGNAVFQLFSGGKLAVEASVSGVDTLKAADFFVDEDGFHTGFAMANPSTVTASGTLVLYDTKGSQVGSVPISLGASQHAARFLFEMIAGAPSGRAELRLSAGALAVTALRYDSSFSVFSTLGVSDLSASVALLPSLTSMNPTRVAPGMGAFTLVLSGERFHSGSRVYWNSTELSVTSRSLNTTPQTLSAAVTANLTAASTTAAVKVVNPAGSTNEGTSNSLTFTVSGSAYP